MENYYEILGIPNNASDTQIKNAYLKKMKIYHPDIYKGDKKFAEEKTRQITEAYTILKSYLGRKNYDEKLKKTETKKNESKSEKTNKQSSYSETKQNSNNSNTQYKKNVNCDTNFQKYKKENTDDKNKENNEEININNNRKEDNSKQNINTKNIGSHIDFLTKSEQKDKKILNFIIITLTILLILSICMTFITINR